MDGPPHRQRGTVDAAEGMSRPQRADAVLAPREFVLEQPSNKADSSPTGSMVMPEKSLQPTEPGSPIRFYLAALAILLAVVLALVWSPTPHTDNTARDTAVSRAAQSVTVTAPVNSAHGSRAASQSATEPDAGRSAPVDAAPTQLLPDVGLGQPAAPNPTTNADGTTKNQEYSGPSQPEVSAKRPSKTSIRRRRTKRLPKRLVEH